MDLEAFWCTHGIWGTTNPILLCPGNPTWQTDSYRHLHVTYLGRRNASRSNACCHWLHCQEYGRSGSTWALRLTQNCSHFRWLEILESKSYLLMVRTSSILKCMTLWTISTRKETYPSTLVFLCNPVTDPTDLNEGVPIFCHPPEAHKTI